MDVGVRKTIFVRNLPYTATNKALEELYQDAGPIKSCFVVTDPGTQKCRGFGYVKFAMKEDAETAFKSPKVLDGRKLVMHYADRKPTKKKKKQKPKLGDSDDEEEAASASDEDEEDKIKKEEVELKDKKDVKQKTPKETSKTSKKQKKDKTIPQEDKSVEEDFIPLEHVKKSPDSNKPNDEESTRKNSEAVLKGKEKHKEALTLVIKGFESSQFEDDYKPVITGLKNVRKVIYPAPDRKDNEALVMFKSNRDAMRASRRLTKQKIKGTELSAVLLTVEKSQAKAAATPKRCRLIIRNLSFKCNEEKLKDTFTKFGDIMEVVIPKKNDGKMIGFGFVQFTTIESANSAMQQMNAKPILGRRVAVDWAVSKKKFEEISKKIVESPKESSDSGSFSSEDDKKEEDDAASDTSASSEGESGNESEAESDAEQDEDESDESSSGDEGFDDSEADSDEEESDEKSKKPPRKSDVDEGRTLFIRNLSYDTEEEALEDFFEQFGELKYCRVVVDPMTERSRGTAFVQFKKKEDTEKALAAASDPEKPEGLVLDSRKLSLALALPRETAQKLQQNKKQKEERDSRNLYLAREGMIRPGTQAAEGMAAADLNRRLQVEKIKRQKLRNPNIFISDKRLCVRNIPVSVEDNTLRKAFLKAVGNKAARVTECRIMRDMERVNAEGKGKSRGYGFIAFREHKDALEALRATNNSPNIFGENRRLIVEFSLENRTALQTKEKRLERAKAKQETLEKGKNTFVEPKLKKKPREDRRKAIASPSDATDTAQSVKKGPKGLPSHWGPKIRDRDRGKNLKPARKPKDKRSRTQAQQVKEKRRIENQGEPPKAKKRKTGQRKGEIRDDVDILMNKYRNKFSAAFAKSKAGSAKSKWFDTS